MIGYFILICLAFVLLKFVSEFDYQLRKDKVEYAVKWREDFKSEKWEQLSLDSDSRKASVMVPPIDTTHGSIEIITKSESTGYVNTITLKVENKVLSKKNVQAKRDTIRFNTHNIEGQQTLIMKDTMHLDFEMGSKDSTLVKAGHTFKILGIKLYQLKKQEPFF